MIIVDSNQTEFGYELISCVPYAYWLHKNGGLQKVISCNDTKCLYFFTENHEEIYDSRSEYKKPDVPNGNIHRAELDTRMWEPPPLNLHYKNDRFVWDKPICVVCNKYKDDGRNPIGLDTEFLEMIFKKLTPHHTVIYNRPLHKNITHDESGQIDIGDFKLISDKFPQVIDINSLHRKNSDLSFNTLQLMILANGEKFISSQGGSSILCSYFGGTNIIYAYEGKEIECGSYKNWYHAFSGSKIVHAKSKEALYEAVCVNFL